jgi:hypothetical protein
MSREVRFRVYSRIRDVVDDLMISQVEYQTKVKVITEVWIKVYPKVNRQILRNIWNENWLKVGCELEDQFSLRLGE